MRTISVLLKPASGMCNMVCDYCFYCDEAEKRTRQSYGFMSEETLKNVIKRTLLRAEGAASYTWQGGEPSLRGLDFYKKAVAMQQAYNRNHVRIFNAFQTNGYAVTKEWCRFWKENNFLVGLSLDGTPAIHDSMRHDKQGKPTFQNVERTAKLLDTYQVDYNLLTVVTPKVADHIKAIYQSYKEHGWRYQQYIACLDPYGEGHGKTPYSVSPEQYGQFLSDLFALWYADLKQGCHPYIRQFENYVGLAAGHMAEACEQRGVCGVQYVVEADGSVYPCDFYAMDAYYLGNLNTAAMVEIDEKRREIGFVERSLKLDNNCKRCKYFSLCRGGCMRSREYMENEDLYRNYFCEGYRFFFGQWYDRIMELGRAFLRIN